jgi:hypothetical protein
VKKSGVVDMYIRGFESDGPLILNMKDAEIETVQKYLGSICSAVFSMQVEVSQRLASAGRAFHNLTCIKLWKDYVIFMKTKVTLYKVRVKSVVLYGCKPGL